MEQALRPWGYLRGYGASPVCVSVRGVWGTYIVVCAPRDEPSPRCGDPSGWTVRVLRLGATLVAPRHFTHILSIPVSEHALPELGLAALPRAVELLRNSSLIVTSASRIDLPTAINEHEPPTLSCHPSISAPAACPTANTH